MRNLKALLTCLVTALLLSSLSAQAAAPTLAEIAEAVSAVQSSSLSDEEKASQLVPYTHGEEVLSAYQSLLEKKAKLDADLAKASSELLALQQETAQVTENSEQSITIPQDDAALAAKLSELTASLNAAQKDLSDASTSLVSLQTLPNRAQSLISRNNARVNEIHEAMSALAGSEDSLKYRLLDFELAALNEENAFIEKELSSQGVLQDLANARAALANAKIKALNSAIEMLQEAQNRKLEGSVPEEAYISALFEGVTSMAAELDSSRQIITALNRQLKDNAQMVRELSQVEGALTALRQVEKNLNEQLTGLESSYVLSRLLNRQQSEIPNVSISFNLDELIPNLNLWLYDLRVYREKLLDENTFVDRMIAKNPELEPRRADLLSFVKVRRSLVNELYQAISLGLANAINLKVRYEEFTAISSRVETTISEHLFWLSSNLPLGADFILNLPRQISSQVSAFITDAGNPLWLKETLTTLALILIPLSVIGFGVRRSLKRLNGLDDKIAMRLDKSSDSILLTPAALFINLVKILPKATFMTAIGTVIIALVLDERAMQFKAVLIIAMHVLVFTYTLEILKPNGIAQRHFALPSEDNALRYALIDRVYLAVLPILIVANIRELDPGRISSDNIGFLVMLICGITLTIITLKSIKERFARSSLSLLDWTRSLISLLVPAALVVMLALGYYYTAIQLINRVALSFYTILVYLAAAQTIRRSLYVIESRMQRVQLAKRREEALKAKKADHLGLPAFKDREKAPDRLEALRFELTNARAFKLINSVLIGLTAIILYLQWNDLAGVLSYLNTVHLWTNTQLANGQEIVVSYLSLANVLGAVVILIITAMLNRSLPPLLERFFMLRLTGAQKSTSYTVRIVSSYSIITLGIILAAGSLGISWNNLQWLVAALSVGLGFGLQEIFGNFVSGLIILFERQIRVGDIITLNNLSGTVSKIRIRSTTVISSDNKEIMIPNKSFITSALTNWSLSNTVTKLEFAVGIAYDADIDKAKRILSNIILNCGNLAPDKPFNVYVTSMDPSCITITCDIFVDEIGKRKPTFDYLCRETIRRFNKAGIEIPFDQLEVKLKNTTTGDSLKVSMPELAPANREEVQKA